MEKNIDYFNLTLPETSVNFSIDLPTLVASANGRRAVPKGSALAFSGGTYGNLRLC